MPKDQYQALIEVQQNIWDGGQIHHQKKEIKAVSQENKYQLDVSMYALKRTGQSGILRDIALKRTVASERSAP